MFALVQKPPQNKKTKNVLKSVNWPLLPKHLSRLVPSLPGLELEKERPSVYRAEEYIDFIKTRLEYDMPFFLRSATFLGLALLLFTSGCYNTPVRHLASDAVLINAGSSSRNDVLTYLGEPDRQRRLPDDSEEWVYSEETRSDLQRIPLLGGVANGKGREKIIIVLKNDIVQSCQFREFGNNEFNWADDYAWQEKGE
jgi:hypothetical protein